MSPYTGPIRRIDRGRGHRYEDANGLTVPGVTTILKALPKDKLLNWSATATADAAVNRWDELAAMPPAQRLNILYKARYDDRDKAGNRGKEVHTLAEGLVHGERVSVPDELVGHVGSYVSFLDEWDVDPVLVEAVIFSHSYGWAGTLDLVADLPKLGRCLIDIKTGRSGVFGETALQLAGYRYADTYLDDDGEEQDMPEVDWCGAVWVARTGYELRRLEVDEWQLMKLRYLLEVSEWVAADERREFVGEPETPPTTSRYRLTREEAVA